LPPYTAEQEVLHLVPVQVPDEGHSRRPTALRARLARARITASSAEPGRGQACLDVGDDRPCRSAQNAPLDTLGALMGRQQRASDGEPAETANLPPRHGQLF
jgi:hypothetical protein